MKTLRNRRSNALAFVLGLVFMASVLSVYLVEYSIAELKPRASANHERTLRTDALSALNASIAVLQEYLEIDKGLYSETQGWGEPFADGRITLPNGTEAVVKITDESGKLPLRTKNASDLAKILEEMGASSIDSQKIAACIIDWCDSDDTKSLDGAEYDDYDYDEAFPPNRFFESFAELKFIKEAQEFFFDQNGEPNNYYKFFAQIFSLENFSKTNYNSASPEVLRIVMEADGRRYSDTLYEAIQGRAGSVSNGKVWLESISDIESRSGISVPTANMVVKAELLKIEITVKRGAGEYYLCAYVTPDTTASASGGVANRGGQNNNASPQTSASNAKLKVSKLKERGA